ncbi:50S ribosomal protein L2 [Candidatus Saccharibacteria bacterium]|nr:50S ribosomal protein L2 [Candidatus Saccharibacteria bacterium]
MAVKPIKATTPGRRGMTTQDFSQVTTNKPLKSLTVIKRRTNGRNNQGKITIRHRGGGTKRFYRVVDFKQINFESATIEAIEYDPNRSANIARIKDNNGVYHYVIASASMRVGQKLHVGDSVAIENGNRLPLKSIPTGSFVYAIELHPGKGAQMVRSAGAKAQLTAKEGDYAQIKLPSGEVRMVNVNCMASLGTVSNMQHQNVKIGSAGRNRKLGRRPQVKGKVMNAADHPHGGGDGGKHGVGRHPKTPWGKPALGYKTRRNKRSGKFIVRTRHQAKRK